MSFRKRNSLNTSHIKHDDAKENIITLTPKKDNKNETKEHSIQITYVTDADIKEHIISLKSTKENTNKTTRTKKRKNYYYVSASDTESYKTSDSEDEDSNNVTTSQALSETTEIGGNNIYGFKTNFRSDKMIKKAQQVVDEKKEMCTPVKAKKRSSKHVLKVSTARKLRSRNKIAMSSDSSSTEDYEEEEEEEEEEEVVLHESSSDSDTAAKTDKLQDYFTGQAGGQGVLTTDNTLARLAIPRMDTGQLSAVLREVTDCYEKEVYTLTRSHRRSFHLWMLQMCCGFNILLFGVGSKRNLLNDFRNMILDEFSHIVVNGYFPSITIKSILTSITEDIIEDFRSFRNVVDQSQFIHDHFNKKENGDFYLVVHNIDGSMLQSARTQSILSRLASSKHIHVIASVDHINAPLLWDGATAARFNWTYNDATTFSRYSEETSYENSLLVKHSGSLALSSLKNVSMSLTANARGIFRILIDYQLSADESSNIQGYALPDLYQKCREAFLVNSDLTLRTQLIEFVDHKLIRMKKGLDGVEYLTIPLDKITLTKFIEEINDD